MDKKEQSPEMRKAQTSLASVIDFLTFLTDYLGNNVRKIAQSINALPREYDVFSVAEEIYNAYQAKRYFSILIVNAIEARKELWDLHGPLIVYRDDASTLITHSLLSALTSHYSIAYTEMRCAIESVVRGVIYDFLVIPEYRRKATILQKIKGYKGAEGFPELIELLENTFGDKRPEKAIIVCDLIEKRLKKFNPRVEFSKLLEQLKVWNIINECDYKEIFTYYSGLSEYVHKTKPRFSEPGIRIISDRDWVDLEPVPDRLFVYFYHVADLCGILTYLTLKALEYDLKRSKPIPWDERILEGVKELKSKHLLWEGVYKIMKSLM